MGTAIGAAIGAALGVGVGYLLFNKQCTSAPPSSPPVSGLGWGRLPATDSGSSGSWTVCKSYSQPGTNIQYTVCSAA